MLPEHVAKMCREIDEVERNLRHMEVRLSRIRDRLRPMAGRYRRECGYFPDDERRGAEPTRGEG